MTAGIVLGIILVSSETFVTGQQFNSSTEFPVFPNTTHEAICCYSPTTKPAITGAALGCLLLLIFIVGIILGLAKRRSNHAKLAARALPWSTHSMMYRETVSPSFVETRRESLNASARTPTAFRESMNASVRPPTDPSSSALSTSGQSDDIPVFRDAILTTQSMTSSISDGDGMTSSISSPLPSYDEVMRQSQKESDNHPPPYSDRRT